MLGKCQTNHVEKTQFKLGRGGRSDKGQTVHSSWQDFSAMLPFSARRIYEGCVWALADP